MVEPPGGGDLQEKVGHRAQDERLKAWLYFLFTLLPEYEYLLLSQLLVPALMLSPSMAVSSPAWWTANLWNCVPKYILSPFRGFSQGGLSQDN